MAQPTQSDVHVNVPLTNLSVAFFQEADAFVATRAFPNVPVQKQSDRYYVYNRGDFNRNLPKIRAAAAESEGSGYKLDNTPTYFADVWALHKDIPDQVLANSDAVLAPELEATRWLTQSMLISKEVQWANTYFGTGIWGSERAGNAAPSGTQFLFWDNNASTPIEDMRAAKRSVHLKSGGYMPNVCIFGAQVWDKLQDHPDFIDRVKYGQTFPNPAQVTKQLIAELLGFEEILVMEGIVNNAPEDDSNTVNANNESNAYIGGKHCLLVYRPAAPGLMVPSAGYTFSWTGMFGAGVMGNRISSFRMEWKKLQRVEIEAAYALKLVASELGFFFNGAIS